MMSTTRICFVLCRRLATSDQILVQVLTLQKGNLSEKHMLTYQVAADNTWHARVNNRYEQKPT